MEKPIFHKVRTDQIKREAKFITLKKPTINKVSTDIDVLIKKLEPSMRSANIRRAMDSLRLAKKYLDEANQTIDRAKNVV